MAIFSRRTLQRLINENASFLINENDSFLEKKQTEKHIKELNNGKLEFEWEVVLLNVFSKLGKVIHEPKLVGSEKKIDILFQSKDNPKIEFLADIRTISSDVGLESKNPQKQFTKRLVEEIEKNKLTGSWHYKIGSRYEEETVHSEDRYEDESNEPIQELKFPIAVYSKCELKLPSTSMFDTVIFNQEFEDFLSKINNSPNQSRIYRINPEFGDLEITYSSNDEFILSGNFANYKQPNNWTYIKDNRIYGRLEEKNDQLKKSGYKKTLGIIICDGGTELLRKSKHVILEFLKNNKHINFILAFDIEQNFGFRNYSQVKIYFEKGQELREELEEFFSYLHKHTSEIFPYPIKNAVNAVISSKNYQTNKINSFYKGATMETGGARIKLSSRKILELLAGKISYDEFPKEYKDYFKDMLDKGKLITEVEIEIESDEDDDLLIFKFGEPDAAVSDFKMPDTY